MESLAASAELQEEMPLDKAGSQSLGRRARTVSEFIQRQDRAY